MAYLGVISGTYTPAPDRNSALVLVTDYNINRGRPLGAVAVIVNRRPDIDYPLVSNYIIRQLRIIYRQLWPTHGQRFPQ